MSLTFYINFENVDVFNDLYKFEKEFKIKLKIKPVNFDLSSIPNITKKKLLKNLKNSYIYDLLYNLYIFSFCF